MVVSWANAAPAPCCSMERPCCHVWCWGSRATGARCAPSREWPGTGSCTPSRKPLQTSAPPSAATVLPRFSSQPKPYWPRIPTPRATRSRTRWRATSAAAPATSRSTKPSSSRPSACGRWSMAGHRIIGKAMRKVDAVAKVTGATRFADDLAFPRTLYCKLLRSTHPHAKIVSVDITAAKQLAGVQAVLTGQDLPIPFGILPVSQDEHALCLDKVRFVGDPVAAVAAVDEDTAFDAMNAIEVEYEPLDAMMSIEEAIRKPSPRIHEYGDEGNIHKKIALEFGDVERGFHDADQVFEDTFYYEGSTHLPMEQHAAVAAVDPDGKLTVWSSTQTPHYVHRALAKVLNMPPARIRVIACPNGGG